MANAYLTVPELQNALPVSDSGDVVLLGTAIDGASRSVDAYCGQRFWADATVKTREYWASGNLARVDPISTTNGLIVKTDPASDGTFGTTLTITTDFVLLPANAPDNYPAAPYTQILLPDTTFPWSARRPNLQVTATFGWPAVPEDVKAAAMLLARDLYKELKDAPFGVAGVAEFGVLRIRQNPTARMLLGRYRRALVA